VRRAARRQYGLLEKKKDYKERADDFHRKEDALRRLRRKAEERNPDEFYFAMEKARTRGGVHTKRRVAAKPAQAPRWRRASAWPASLGLRLTGVGGVQLHRGQQVHAGGAAAHEDAGRELHHAQGSGGGAGAPRRTLRLTSLPLLPACWPPHCGALLLFNWLSKSGTKGVCHCSQAVAPHTAEPCCCSSG